MTRIPNCQGIVLLLLLLFPILSCARVKYEAHYVGYYRLRRLVFIIRTVREKNPPSKRTKQEERTCNTKRARTPKVELQQKYCYGSGNHLHPTCRSQKSVIPLSTCETSPFLLSSGRDEYVRCDVFCFFNS